MRASWQTPPGTHILKSALHFQPLYAKCPRALSFEMLLQDSLAAGVRVIDAAIADAALNTIADAIRTQV